MAAQALMSGSWSKAYDHLAALTSWSLVSRKDETLAMLRGKLQVGYLLMLTSSLY